MIRIFCIIFLSIVICEDISNDQAKIGQLDERYGEINTKIGPSSVVWFFRGYNQHFYQPVMKAQEIKISIGNTKINGRIKSFNGTDVGVFYGIPYAEPPIGELRFKEPKPLERWPKVINALEPAVACIQMPNPLNPFADLGNNGRVSEDCLYLNIWTPIIDNNELKTVMVFIHGGSNVVGSSNQPIYESTVLSAAGNVVVVSLNYRLGIFGFLYTGTDVGPGNMALRDQILALQWVKNNIIHFGGDPNKITLVGESAGGFDTSLLMLSPASRHLFKRAIMMSGAALGTFGIYDSNVALQYWKSAAKLVDCTDNGYTGVDSLSPLIIECLLNTDANQLITTNFNSTIEPNFLLFLPYFVKDGLILTDNTLEMIKQTDFKQRFDLLIGTTDNEGSILLPWFGGLQLFNPRNPANLTFSEAYNYMMSFLSRLPIQIPINTNEIAKLYFTGLSEQSDPALFSQAIGLAFGDFLLTCPTVLFARTLFKYSNEYFRVNQYVFNSKFNGRVKLDCYNWMGVCHGQDIPPVFGQTLVNYESLNRERDISIQMIKFFTDFAKTGQIPAQNGQEWYSFYRINNRITAPYYEIKNDLQTSNVKTGFKLNECLNLWKDYIWSQNLWK